MYIWVITTRLRLTYFTVMSYEYCRKILTLVLIQACTVSQRDAVYKEEALTIGIK